MLLMLSFSLSELLLSLTDPFLVYFYLSFNLCLLAFKSVNLVLLRINLSPESLTLIYQGMFLAIQVLLGFS